MRPVVAACVLAWALLTGPAQAEGFEEFWPEVAVYKTLSPETRLFLNLPYAGNPDARKATLDIAAYLDISLLPILRPSLHTLDWQRSRFLWARIGLDHVVQSEDGIRSVAENRGIVSVLAKAELPQDIWLESRVRADLRWLDGDYSTRWRYQLEATREFTVVEHTVVPYAHVEWFYDTRFGQWSRTMYQAGAEITVDPSFRLELYVVRQDDRVPTASNFNALGVVAKWYY
jgi:hypothetical protein